MIRDSKLSHELSLYHLTCFINLAPCESLNAHKVTAEEEVCRLTKIGRARFRLPGPKSTQASNATCNYMAGRRNSGSEPTGSTHRGNRTAELHGCDRKNLTPVPRLAYYTYVSMCKIDRQWEFDV